MRAGCARKHAGCAPTAHWRSAAADFDGSFEQSQMRHSIAGPARDLRNRDSSSRRLSGWFETLQFCLLGWVTDQELEDHLATLQENHAEITTRILALRPWRFLLRITIIGLALFSPDFRNLCDLSNHQPFDCFTPLRNFQMPCRTVFGPPLPHGRAVTRPSET